MIIENYLLKHSNNNLKVSWSRLLRPNNGRKKQKTERKREREKWPATHCNDTSGVARKAAWAKMIHVGISIVWLKCCWKCNCHSIWLNLQNLLMLLFMWSDPCYMHNNNKCSMQTSWIWSLVLSTIMPRCLNELLSEQGKGSLKMYGDITIVSFNTF